VFEDIRAAITYLFPGFLAYGLLYRRLVPARGESDLVLTAKSVIWSLAVNVVVGLPGTVWHYRTDWADASTVAAQFVIALASGLGLGMLERHLNLTDRAWAVFGAKGVGRPDVWSEMLRYRDKKGVVVLARLSDGSAYYGALTRYTDVPDAEPKEIYLEDTWVYKPGTDEPEHIGYPVLVRSDAILSIEIGQSGDEIEKGRA